MKHRGSAMNSLARIAACLWMDDLWHMDTSIPIPRRETRIQMEIPVVLEGIASFPARKQRLRKMSARRCTGGQRPALGQECAAGVASRTGEFRSAARVAYCQPIHGEGYAIGVEFLEPHGRWVVNLQISLTNFGEGWEGTAGNT